MLVRLNYQGGQHHSDLFQFIKDQVRRQHQAKSSINADDVNVVYFYFFLLLFDINMLLPFFFLFFFISSILFIFYIIKNFFNLLQRRIMI